jgi:hypothetical protein
MAATAIANLPDPASPATELAVAPAPPQRLTLYALEEQLVALSDTVEMVEPEQEQEFLKQFQQALTAAVEKRDRVGQFMAHLEQQAAFASAEIKRLQERKQFYDAALDRIEKYVTLTIESLGRDAKGKHQKLEGKTVTFQLKKCPASVEITDESQVPATYKSVTLTLPAVLYDELLDSLDLDFAGKIADAVRKASMSVSKTDVKADLQAKQEVPGAHLVDDKYRLERK